MKSYFVAVSAAAVILIGNLAYAQEISSEKEKLSYALGYQLGRESGESDEQLNIEMMIDGLKDGHAKKEPVISIEEMRTVYQSMRERLQEKLQVEFKKVAEENLVKSQKFLEENKKKSGVKVLAGGVQYKVLEKGRGSKPTDDSTISLEVLGPYPWGENRKC